MLDAFEKLNRFLDGPPGMNQADFGRKVGASQGQVSKWARRASRPTARHMARLNKVLGTTFEEWIRAPLSEERKRRERTAA